MNEPKPLLNTSVVTFLCNGYVAPVIYRRLRELGILQPESLSERWTVVELDQNELDWIIAKLEDPMTLSAKLHPELLNKLKKAESEMNERIYRGEGRPMSDHRVPDIPIYPSSSVTDAWESSCSCGYGLTADSPEAAIIAMAQHLTHTERGG